MKKDANHMTPAERNEHSSQLTAAKTMELLRLHELEDTPIVQGIRQSIYSFANSNQEFQIRFNCHEIEAWVSPICSNFPLIKIRGNNLPFVVGEATVSAVKRFVAFCKFNKWQVNLRHPDIITVRVRSSLYNFDLPKTREPNPNSCDFDNIRTT